jgi:hypothetical protein
MANVGYATLQIIPSARGFGTALNGQVAPQMGAAGAASGKKFGSGLLGTFKSVAGPLAAVAGTAALAGFFKGAITGASDLAETLSKTKVIFGDATKSVVAFAEDSKRNILLTKQEALDASATFGVFGKSAGLTGKELGGFSTQLTALAGDLSSFYNTSTDEAITALGAALRGESEPIRKYGVLLDDASMRAEALRLGLISSVKTALTPANKVLAAQSLILAKTTDAQGDAARTADGFANQTRILNKNFVDIRNEVGSALLPAVTKLTTLLANNLKPAFETIKTAAQPIIAFFKSFGDESGKTSAKVQVFKDALTSIGASITPLIQIVGDFGKQIFAIVGPAFKEIGDIIMNQLVPAFAAVLPIVRPVAEFFLKIIGNAVIGALKGTINFIKGALKVITGVFNVFAGVFTGDFKKVWNGVKSIFSGFIQAVTGAFQFFWNIGILGIFRKAGLALINLGKGAVGGLKNAFVAGLNGLLGFMKTIPSRMLNIYLRLPSLMLNVGKNIMTGLINGIKSMASILINTIKSTVTDKLPSFVKKALGIASPSKVFQEIGKNVGLGFIKGVQGTQDQIRSAFAKIAEDIKKTGSKVLIKAVDDAQKKILGLAKTRDVLRDTFKAAKDNLKDLQETASDFAKGIVDSFRSFTSVAGFSIQEADLPKLQESLADANDKLADSQGRIVLANKAMSDAVTKYGISSTQAATARERLLKAERDLADAQRAATTAQTDLNDAQNGSLVTSQRVIADFKKRVTAATGFFQQIKALQSAGLNQTSLQEILNSGVETGSQIAAAVLDGGKGAITEINQLQGLFEKEAKDLGKSVSDAVYGPAIAESQKVVKSLADDLTSIEGKIAGVAATLAKEIAKIGKINAPSWLKDLIGVTKYTTTGTATAPKSPTVNSRTSGTNAGTSGSQPQPGVVINNYNPIAEPTSVTVSNTLTRLALIGAYDR